MAHDIKQMSLLNEYEKDQADNQSVVCLGMKFENNETRREYFRNELRKKLPELKEIKGFPIGEDEDIIVLSDPPYYTACPNPWINDFIKEWELEKVAKYGHGTDEGYHREPFATDVSEGKNDPIYNAHSYHTKVPYRAIMRYLTHYTSPNDIVYDGFAGSGMTGVAAELCADKDIVKDLLGEEFSENKVGKRNAITIDLAPAATFINYNYNKAASYQQSQKLTTQLMKLRNDFEWAFSTLNCDLPEQNSHQLKEFYNKNKKYFSEINYVVWSEQYICSACTKIFSYWDGAVSKDEKIVSKELTCPHCLAKNDKKNLERVFETTYDPQIENTVTQPKLVPVKINYSFNKKRMNKEPDWYDLKVIDFFENNGKLNRIPIVKFEDGVKTSEPIRFGFTHVHHVYTKKILASLDKYLECCMEDKVDSQFLLGSTIPKLSKMNRFMPQHGSRALVGPMANALYFPPLCVENNVLSQFEFQLKKIEKAWTKYDGTIISTQSSTKLKIPDESVDYIFLDPPFGANIMYSELSFIREAWLKLFTNNKKEAIENKSQGKSLDDYTSLMSEAFNEAYRILKPGRWMTVEFSNTQASVWNALQSVIQRAGFVIASVNALNKKRGGFHAMITTTAVKQDLVISAYKPLTEDIVKMKQEKNTQESVWTFITQHLSKLPVFLGTRGNADFIVEREPRILFDRMIAYHIQNSLPISISASEFQEKLPQKFIIRDGMVFLESQVAEYDKKRILFKEFSQMSLFVSDENSAIEWIRQQLKKKPQTYQDLQPDFMKEIQHVSKHEKLPELEDLLQQNFLRYEGDEEVPSQITTYLRGNYPDLRGLNATNSKVIEKAMNRWYIPNPNKQADLEKLREKSLLREFEGYIIELEKNKKKLKQFRTEAIRAGFKKAYSEKDFKKIVKVGERLPESVIQEDDKLLMYLDNACMRLGI